MSADKGRSLRRRTAWLRLACRRRERGDVATGLALQVRHGHARTADVQRLLDDGHARLLRVARPGGRMRVTTCVATPEGEAFLAATLARHGAGFGPEALADELDPRGG